MRIIDDIVCDFRYKKYKDRFLKFRVSPIMVTVINSDDGINIIKLVNKSQDYINLKDLIIVDLLGPRENDYLIFSLLFGLYFDVFNLYNYIYVSPEVRRDIAITDPNSSYTKNIFKENDSDIFSYFKEKYGLDREDYDRLVKSLFEVNSQESILYNSPIIVDMGKILMGSTLQGSFSSCSELIELFDRKNEINTKKLV